MSDFIDIEPYAGALGNIATISGRLSDSGSLSCALSGIPSLRCQLSGESDTFALITDDDSDLITNAGDDLIGIGFTDVVGMAGHLSPMATLSAQITIPTATIPSNYGRITWDGSTLTVS